MESRANGISIEEEVRMMSYARIRRLTEPNREGIDQTFQRLANLLRDTGRTAVVRCTILEADQRGEWIFDLQENECSLYNNSEKVPDLEIITRVSTWWEIADGRLSPLEAFLLGRLRILGDSDLGSQLLRHVAESGGVTSICGE